MFSCAFLQQVTETSQAEIPPARFQRTDQWLPVYSWLESLDKDEVVKSKDISDWLTQNPEIKEHLCSKHSRYHLMHYIKKCHVKILKRRERKKVANASHLKLFLVENLLSVQTGTKHMGIYVFWHLLSYRKFFVWWW